MNQPYEKILHAERPVHLQDAFSAKHPPMPREKRAKLFAPFDALAGYGEALDAQEVIYQEREVLSEEKRQELDKKLDFLRSVYRECRQGTKYVGGSLAVRAFEPPCVTIRYFEEVPGQDGRGLYHTVSGAVVKIDLEHGYTKLFFEPLISFRPAHAAFPAKPFQRSMGVAPLPT